MIVGSSDGRWWQNGCAGSRDTYGRILRIKLHCVFGGWAVIGQELGF